MRYGNLQVFSGNAHPELAKQICHHLGTRLADRDIIRFSNENLLIQIKENVSE